MTDAELKRLRRSFLLLPIVILVLTLASRLYIRQVGHTYTRVLDGDYTGVALDAENIHIEPERMARVKHINVEPNGSAHVTFEAERQESGQVIVTTEAAGESFPLFVDIGNVIICDSVNFTGWQTVAASIVAVFTLTCVLCVHAAHTLFRRSWYGHDMVAYVGGALFSGTEAFSFARAALPGRATEFVDFLMAITTAAEDFVALTLIPMGIAAVFVCISNLQLVRHEGLRPVNILGIAASVLWMSFNVIPGAIHAITGTTLDPDVFWFSLLAGSALSAAIAFAETVLVSTSICAWMASRHRPTSPRDAIIILGCGIRADGTPTPLLAGRVDAALSYAAAEEATGRPACTFVASGGQGPNEVVSEAASMAGYLSAKGVREDHILLEMRSTTTNENFALSRQVMEAAGCPTTHVAFATTNYHVFRGYVCAHDAGLAAEGIAAPTRLYFWPNAFLREVAGIVSSRWPHMLAALIIICGLYVLAEFALLI